MRDQRNRTHPTFGTHTSPTWRDKRRTSLGLTATTRNPSSRPAFRHDGRRAGFSGSKKAAIAYLASPLATATTGTALAVDGGMQGLRLRPRPA